MDAQTFIQKNSRQQMGELYRVYNCNFQTHTVIKKSDDVLIKEHGFKIFFDQIRYKIFIGRTKESLINTLQEDRFPIASTEDLKRNCIEVDDVVLISWYGKQESHEIGVVIAYIIKNNKIIGQYTKLN